MKKTFIDLVLFSLGIMLAYLSLVHVGNNEEHFSRYNSPTTIFIISVVIVGWSSIGLTKAFFNSFLPKSSIFRKEATEVFHLSEGQAPYLEAIGYLCLGSLFIAVSAPFMDDAASLFTNQYLALAGVMVIGVLCFMWGLLTAFLTFIRLSDEDRT